MCIAGNRRKLSLCVSLSGMLRMLPLEEPCCAIGILSRKRVVGYISSLQRCAKASIVLSADRYMGHDFRWQQHSCFLPNEDIIIYGHSPAFLQLSCMVCRRTGYPGFTCLAARCSLSWRRPKSGSSCRTSASFTRRWSRSSQSRRIWAHLVARAGSKCSLEFPMTTAKISFFLVMPLKKRNAG
nr:uncharacterized protein LOC129387409 isoform X1 [Dermacentor andersoni]